jgi:HTH-type transcriptional regulator/antitoxin MqsA
VRFKSYAHAVSELRRRQRWRTRRATCPTRTRAGPSCFLRLSATTAPHAASRCRVSALMRDSSKQVNAASIDPKFIVGVRKKLDLDQREAAETFGGGVNAFSRCENGKTRPPLALVKLLKVLDRHPELLGEVRAS